MNKKLSDALIERGVIELEVTSSNYYAERYLYKQHPITNDISEGYLAWPERQVKDRNWTEPKHAATLTEACDKIDEYHEYKQKMLDTLICGKKQHTQKRDHQDVPPKAFQDETDAILLGTQILREELFKLPTENLTHNANLRLDTPMEFKVPSGPNYTYVACGGGGTRDRGGEGLGSYPLTSGGCGGGRSDYPLTGSTSWTANAKVDGELKRDEIKDRVIKKESYFDSRGCIHESQQEAINAEVLYDLEAEIIDYAKGHDLEAIYDDNVLPYELALMMIHRKNKIMDLLYVHEEVKR